MVAVLVSAALVVLAATSHTASANHARISDNHARIESPPPQYSNLTGIHKIRHIVIIMQENRSFDEYFGTYPDADGIPGLAGHPGKVPCLPSSQGHCVRPFHDRYEENRGGPYMSYDTADDIDGGKMNGFVRTEEAVPAYRKSTPPHDVMGYHNGKDIRNYWAYAHDFVLQDHMFAPDLSWSLTSHLYLVSLWSANCTRKGVAASCSSAVNGPTNHNYAWTDLTYLLHKHHVSWRFYYFKGIEPECESDITKSCSPRTGGSTSLPLWNPLPYFTTVRKDHQRGNIQSLNGFFNDIHHGHLPAVSWIVPSFAVSEHPTEQVTVGQTYVTGLIDTIMQSPVWNSTAIFVTWDDWSGFYDNVRPPHVDAEGYGIRVPGLVISPYAKRGHIDHQTLSFDAYAKFIEDDFLGGQRLNPKTDGRPDPRPDVRENVRILGNLLADFDFNQPPRKPVILPVHPVTDLIAP